MAAPIVVLPEFPTVFPFPGVPPLDAPIGGFPSLAAPVLALADAAGLSNLLGLPQWGIFQQDGSPVLVADAVASVEYVRDYRISDYPQQQGAFASYNKVQTPYQSKVTFLCAQSRFAFLNTVEAACASLDLVVIVTPEVTYPSANLIHYGIRPRTSSGGVTMVQVDVWCEEVRVTAGAALSASSAAPAGTTAAPAVPAGNASITDPQSPNAAPQQQTGNVQPQTPSANQDWVSNPTPPT